LAMVRIHHGPPYFYKEFKALHLCSAFFSSGLSSVPTLCPSAE
jgi:hypothetical protein